MMILADSDHAHQILEPHPDALLAFAPGVLQARFVLTRRWVILDDSNIEPTNFFILFCLFWFVRRKPFSKNFSEAFLPIFPLNILNKKCWNACCTELTIMQADKAQ